MWFLLLKTSFMIEFRNCNLMHTCFAKSLIAAVWNICEANLCFMEQQPDPSHSFRMRWVLPYSRDIRCSCTEIQLHTSKCPGSYHISIPEAKNYFFTDEPLVYVNNESQESLQILLECKEGISRCYFIFCLHNTFIILK